MERRRKGHIIAINSLCGYEAIFNTLYTTTKFAVRGFMECLTEYLRYRKLENEVFTSTVYPTILNTRQEVIDYMNLNKLTTKNKPFAPDEAADIVVRGILKNHQEIFIPWSYSALISFLR